MFYPESLIYSWNSWKSRTPQSLRTDQKCILGISDTPFFHSYVVYVKSTNTIFTNLTVVLHNPAMDTVEVVIDNLSSTEGYQFKVLAQHEHIVLKELASVGVSLNLPPGEENP